VASFLAAVLTDVYLCDVCSCQEILRHNGRGQAAEAKAAAAAAAEAERAAAAAAGVPMQPAKEKPKLPPGWEQSKTKDGRTYYQDHNTKKTYWKLPPEALEFIKQLNRKPEPALPGYQQVRTAPEPVRRRS
jgi:hypothetical protein